MWMIKCLITGLEAQAGSSSDYSLRNGLSRITHRDDDDCMEIGRHCGRRSYFQNDTNPPHIHRESRLITIIDSFMYIVRTAHYFVDKNLHVRCGEGEKGKHPDSFFFHFGKNTFALNVHSAASVWRDGIIMWSSIFGTGDWHNSNETQIARNRINEQQFKNDTTAD